MILLKPGERYSDLNVLNKACKSVRGDDYIYLSYDPKTRKRLIDIVIYLGLMMTI